MKISTSVLTALVSEAKHYTSAKSTLPVLRNVHLEVEKGRFVVSATDLETTLKISTPCDDPHPIAPITVPVRELLNFLAILKDHPTVELAGGPLALHIDKHSLRGIDASEFPPLKYENKPDFEDNFLRLTPLAGNIQKVNWCVSSDAARPDLNYIAADFFKDHSYQLAATQGYTIGISRETPVDPASAEHHYYFSRAVTAGLLRLEKLGETSVCLSIHTRMITDARYLRILGQSNTSKIPGLVWELYADADERKFPPWWSITEPQAPVLLTRLLPAPQVRALARAGIVFETPQVFLNVVGDKTHLAAKSYDITYHDEVQASTFHNGKPIVLALAAKFLKEILDCFPTLDTLPLTFPQSVLPADGDKTEQPYISVKVPVKIIIPCQAFYVIMPMHSDSSDASGFLREISELVE